MEKFLLVLLGITIWQLVVFITILITNENDEKVCGVGMGFAGWLIYGIMLLFVILTKWYSKENQAKRIIKSAKKQLKKSKKHWLKWYKKYGKYNSDAWNIVRNNNQVLIEEMKATGFNYRDSIN